MVPGVPLSSWQATACAGMVLALALDLYENPAQLAAIRASFDRDRAGFPCRSRVPQGAQPPFNYRDAR